MCVLLASAALAQTVPADKATASPTIVAPTAPAAAPTAPAAAPTAAELMRASIEKQRVAVRKQAQAAGATLLPWSPAQSPDGALPACEPLADAVVAPLIDKASKTNTLQSKLVRAVIEQESAYRACAMSPKGAQGLMQIMPQTASELSVEDPFDPAENIAAGARYLKQLLDKYKGDTKLALAAYNAGPNAVDAANGVPDIPETRDYVEAILKKIQ
jgi:soluble lytic murein transglycosylase-like protein